MECELAKQLEAKNVFGKHPFEWTQLSFSRARKFIHK